MSGAESKVGRFGLLCLAVGLSASCSGHGLAGSDGGHAAIGGGVAGPSSAPGGASAESGGAGGAAAHAGSSGMAGGTGDAGNAANPDGSGGASGAGGAAGALGNGGGAGAAGHTMDGGACSATACDASCELGFKRDDEGCPTCQCNSTRVSCPNDQCGPPPAGPILMCLDGSVVVPSCAEAASGGCKWGFAPCPPVVCPTLSCAQACPQGSHLDAKGCATCSCILPDECAANGSYELCHAHATCEWLQPGCDSVALAKAGCFPRIDVGCRQDTDCTGQRRCIFRSVSTCPPGSDGGAGCLACVEQTICF